jgi:hypothetical protein
LQQRFLWVAGRNRRGHPRNSTKEQFIDPTAGISYDHPMKRISGPVLLAVSIFCFSGCSSVVESRYHKNVRLDSLKKAYVVHDPGSTLGCANAAEEGLAARGVTVTSGNIQDKPKDADFYVEVVDRWQWDVAMFLASLEIRFIENATGNMIATGSFRQSTFFHTFPDARKKTIEVIDAIYSREPAPK